MHGVECHEGKYMAQSSAPLLLAKLPVGFMSGKLLQRYCPKHLGEGEVRHSKTNRAEHDNFTGLDQPPLGLHLGRRHRK